MAFPWPLIFFVCMDHKYGMRCTLENSLSYYVHILYRFNITLIYKNRRQGSIYTPQSVIVRLPPELLEKMFSYCMLTGKPRLRARDFLFKFVLTRVCCA